MLSKVLIKSCSMTIAILILSFCIAPLVMAQSYSNPCPGEGVWDSCYGTAKTDEGTYTGLWKEGLPHGLGKFEFNDGDFYEGFFAQGFFNGSGSFTKTDGRVISGNYVHNKLEGFASIYDPNKEWRIRGLYVNDKLKNITYMEALGTQTLDHFGLIKATGPNIEDGYVEAEYKNGDKYSGQFKNISRHGKGILTTNNGTTYDGNWLSGLKHGLGVYNSGTETYEQRWENGRLVEKCSDSPTLCSDKGLCRWAAFGDGESWTNAERFEGHVKLAKRKGLTCGIKCDQDPTVCTDIALCEIASVKDTVGFRWNEADKKDHVLEAKSRKISCGVKTCDDNALLCLDSQLCSKATDKVSGKTVWLENWYPDHVKEAKNRKLSCGVDSCAANPSQCSVSDLCLRATTTYGPKSWSLRVNDRAYVQEAKRRKTTCGIIGCDSNPSECDDRQLCKKATFASDNRNYWNTTKNLSYVNLAKLKGLSCNVSPSVGHGQVSTCKGSYTARCIGTREYSNAVYEGQFNAGQRDGPGYTSYDGGDTYVGNYARGNRAGPSLYVWKSGNAIFVDDWDDDQSYTSDTDITRVFPYIKNRFKTLELTERKRLQASLFNKGFYNDDIDGIWGRNSLLALSKFSIFYLETPDLRRHENVEMVLDAVYAQATEEIVIPASAPTKAELRQAKSFASTQSRNLSLVESQYKSLGALNRKQVQWVLKQLGLYKSSIDGLWGPKTQQAMRDYLTRYGYYQALHDTIYSSVLSEMPVPTSFGGAQRQSSSSSSGSGGANLLKLLIVGGLCSATPDPSACLAGAASAVTGDEPPRASGPTYSGSTFSNRPTNTQCRTDFDCGINAQCVSRLGKSICVKLVDNNGRKVYDRNAEPAECRNNTDCPSGFKCDRSMRICLKRW